MRFIHDTPDKWTEDFAAELPRILNAKPTSPGKNRNNRNPYGKRWVHENWDKIKKCVIEVPNAKS